MMFTLQQLLVSTHALSVPHSMRVQAAKAELIAEIHEQGKRSGETVRRHHDSFIGYVWRRKHSRGLLALFDGWSGGMLDMLPLKLDGLAGLSLGADGRLYRHFGGDSWSYCRLENLERFDLEALVLIRDALRGLPS